MMNDTTSRAVFLVAVDEAQSSVLAAQAAARFAALPGSEIHFVHVLGSFESASRDVAIDGGRRLLEARARECGLGDRAVLHLAVGLPWAEIVQLASDIDADVIVVGTSDRGPAAHLLLGSVAQEVARKAHCPVYVARPKAHAKTSRAPEIEPPCAACTAVQRESKGSVLWCERHSQRHARGRLHYEIPPSFAVGASIIRGAS